MGKLHHLDVGCGDATVFEGNRTFLVDCHGIERYRHLLPANKNIRGAFITHQHRDHYSGLEYLRKDGYSIEFLVYSPYERRYGDASVTLEEWKEFASHRDYFASKGTKLRSPYRQSSFDKPWWDAGDVKFWILGPKNSTANSDARALHDACLITKTDFGDRHCLFTGDASDTNLQDVAGIRNNCSDILHVSHHGSINGADLDFVKSTAAQYTVISTAAGVHENVPHPTALKRYSDNTAHRVYRTDEDGSLAWSY